jgi:phage antirepressor YoqD-like protein
MSELIKSFDPSIFEIDQEKGMVNLTRIAQHFGKNVNDWTRNKNTQSFFNAYTNEYPETQILVVKGGNDDQGTWVPRQIAIEFAQWISPQFKVFCIKKLDELFQTGRAELFPARRLSNKEALLLALEAEERAEQAEQKLIEARPKVEFYDEVTESKDVLDFAAVAKVLNKKDFGRNRLLDFLRNKGVLRQSNEPYQQYVDRGWFKIVETKWTDKNGNTKINIKTVVFQKGVDGIRKILNTVA